MVKRIVLLTLPLILLATPLAAQDYSALQIGFGYANWGFDVPDPGFTMVETNRASGFAMHTNYNLTGWFGIDNYLGVYSLPTRDSYGTNFTAFYNVFGVKLTARDLLDGAIAPFVVAGFGGGSVSTDFGSGFGSAAARYGGGVDFNLNDGYAFRVDLSNLAIGDNLLINDRSWNSNFNIATSIIFNLGGF